MSAKSPKLKRKPSLKGKIQHGSNDIPGQLSRHQLQSIECHFNWNIFDNSKEYFISERIQSVEGHIRENAEGTFVASYCLLGYLRSLSEDSENKEQAEAAFLEAVKEAKDDGMKAIVFGNLVTWYTQCGKHEEATEIFPKYLEHCNKYSYLAEHPEVLAMKAFALAYSHKYSDARELYEKALQGEGHGENVHWLFGLALSRQYLSTRRGLYKEDLMETEIIWRRITKLDSNRRLAKLKLARTLWDMHGAHGIEEVEYWIEDALKDNDLLVIFEEAAYLYKNTSVTKKENFEKALQLFHDIHKLNPDSTKTLRGLSFCYFEKYLKMSKKKKKGNSKATEEPSDLTKAIKYLEPISEGRILNRLHLARMYHDRSQFKGQSRFKDKAIEIYETLKDATGSKCSPYDVMEIYYRYACHWRSVQNKPEEIKYLKKAISVPKSPSDWLSEWNQIEKAQERLLALADEMQLIEKFELKSWIQRQRQHYDSAIFYLEKVEEALPEWSESDDNIKNDRIIELLLEALKFRHELFRNDTHERKEQNKGKRLGPFLGTVPQGYLDEARRRIANVKNQQRRCELAFNAMKIEVETKYGIEKHLQDLKRKRIMFEEQDMERKKRTVQFNSIGDEERNKFIDVLTESKRLLDSSINLVKKKIYSKAHNDPPFCYYPNPKNLDKFPSTNVEDKMKKLLEKSYKLEDFSGKLTNLFHFLVKMQPETNSDFDWLQDCIDIRNKTEHASHSLVPVLQLLSPDDRAEKARKFSDYAAEVWMFTKAEVKAKAAEVPSQSAITV